MPQAEEEDQEGEVARQAEPHHGELLVPQVEEVDAQVEEVDQQG